MDPLEEIIKNVYGTTNPDKVKEIKKNPGLHSEVRLIESYRAKKVTLSEDEAKRLIAKNGFEFHKGDEKRIREFTITSESVDRMGDIVRQKGLSSKNFLGKKGNPVVLFGHIKSTIPIGGALDLIKDPGTMRTTSKALIMSEEVDDTGFSTTILKLVTAGFLRATSIGFMPTETLFPTKEEAEALGLGMWGVVFQKSDLLEFSIVDVPANPDALAKYLKSVKDTAEEIKALTNDDIDKIDKMKLFKDDNSLDMFKHYVDNKSLTVMDLGAHFAAKMEKDKGGHKPDDPKKPKKKPKKPDDDEKGICEKDDCDNVLADDNIGICSECHTKALKQHICTECKEVITEENKTALSHKCMPCLKSLIQKYDKKIEEDKQTINVVVNLDVNTLTKNLSESNEKLVENMGKMFVDIINDHLKSGDDILPKGPNTDKVVPTPEKEEKHTDVYKDLTMGEPDLG